MAMLPSRGAMEVGMLFPSGAPAGAQAEAAAAIRMGQRVIARPVLEEEIGAAEDRHVVHDDLHVRDAVAVQVALDADVAAFDLVAQLAGDVAERAGADEAEAVVAGRAEDRVDLAEVDAIRSPQEIED